MNGFPLKFYEADGPFYDGEVEMVVVPTADGEYEVCAHHENVVVAIATGTMKYRPKDGETLYAAVSSGVLRRTNARFSWIPLSILKKSTKQEHLHRRKRPLSVCFRRSPCRSTTLQRPS